MRILAMAALAAPALGFLAEPDPAHPGAATAPADEADAKALFVTHCASCHGENGDGKGTADLDRPARSFLDGGYSYGNTQAAVERSIRHGIPGTPMPAFAETLSADEITAVADHVISLGPEGTIVEPGASVLAVGERPAIVHGMLPALEEGGRREPRSLVIGFPNGTTFAYAKQTAALRAVFVGDFLDRADWRDRGGSPLKPLGALTWTAGPTASAATDLTGPEGASLGRRITAATVTGADTVQLGFDVVDADGAKRGTGVETIAFLDVDGVPAATRAIIVTGTTDAVFAEIEGEPVARLELGGEVFADVLAVEPGLFAIELPMVRTARMFVHAPAWSDALEEALLPGGDSAAAAGDEETNTNQGDQR